ncbi:MAG: hypothetical protein QXL96_02885 [Ignisphaera sp.]
MKLKIATHILLGFITSWIIASVISRENIHHILLAIPILGLTHELLHLASLKMFKLKYRFTLNSLLLGFKATFLNPIQFIVTAITPQILTLALLSTYIITSNAYTLALSIIHIAISYENVVKILRYLVNYFI